MKFTLAQAIVEYEPWLYETVLRMVQEPELAIDITQRIFRLQD